MADQLVKRIEVEKNALANQVEELRKELEATRQPRTQGSSTSGDESDTSGNLNSGVCNMVNACFMILELCGHSEVKCQARSLTISCYFPYVSACASLFATDALVLISNQVEGGETSSHACVELQTPSKSNLVKRTISSTDLTSGLFQELYDAIESDQFDFSFGGAALDLPQEWFGSFQECINA
jgi:hypothetical protein